MRVFRRGLQVVGYLGTALVAIIALALIVSQTPWFRDWMRRYVVRESNQYLTGQLSIGAIGGNLLFGLQVRDVALDMAGERVITVQALDVDYSIFTIISEGIVIDDVRLVEPFVRLERDAEGWNLGRLVRAQEREADREGPGRPITIESIALENGQMRIVDHVGADAYRLPERIDDLQFRGAFAYEPVRYTVEVDHLSLRASDPELVLEELATTVAVRDDTVFVDSFTMRTGESTLTVDGVVENYLDTPVLRMTTTGDVSLPEIGRIVPAVAEYPLSPAFTVSASGPLDQLDLDLDVRSAAGDVRGQVTADVQAPQYGVRGVVDLTALDLAPIVRDPAQRTEITGRADVNLRIAAEPEAAPVTDRMAGTFQFTGPTVMAATYRATDVQATGTIEGPRIGVDARAAAYGARATARGHVVLPAEKRPLAFEFRGAADGVDLRALPEQTGAPALATDLSVAEYHIAGRGETITGSALLNQSVVEGATVATGTTAEFRTGPDGIGFAATGQIRDVNLPRFGRALEIPALEEPAYDGQINGDFAVTGSLPPARRMAPGETAMDVMTLEASGTLRDSAIMGGRLPEMRYDARLAQGGLSLHADGRFEGFNPGTLAQREELDGEVSGTVDLKLAIADLDEPLAREGLTADGRVSLERSTVGGLDIETAAVEGTFDHQVGDVARLQVTGPDLNVEASGRIALDRLSDSDLRYRIEAINLDELARLAGQEEISGAAVLEGTVTGNADTFRTSGTLDGSNLAYGDQNALDVQSEYEVALPDLALEQIRVEAVTEATFVQVAGLELTSLTARTTYADNQLEFTTSLREEDRELDATGLLILHPDHQEVHLPHLALRTAGVEWQMAPELDPRVRYGQDRLEIEDVRLVSGPQVLDVSGVLALKGDTPVGELNVQASNVDLAQVERMLLMDRGIGGTLSADATVSGTIESPLVEGRVEIVNGAFQDYRYQALTADVQYADPQIEIDATLQQSPAEFITAQGIIPVSLFQPSPGGHIEPNEGDRVDLHVQSSAMDLGFVQGFTTAITNVTGTLQADVRITGSGQDPHIEGFVDIRGGAFGVPFGGVSFTGLDTRIELDDDRIRLQQFAIRDEHGAPLNVSGELAIHAREVGDVNIAITSTNFEVLDNELGDVGIDSDILITGDLRRPQVRGTIRLARARLEVDRILQLFYDPYAIEELPPVMSAERVADEYGRADVQTREALRRTGTVGFVPVTREEAEEPQPEAPEALQPEEPGFFDALGLDLKLSIPDNLVLRGRRVRPGGPTAASVGDINITVGGDLQVVKPSGGEMILLGHVQTIRGTYDFQGRRFVLVRGGSIRFMGEPDINPLLDITATRVIPNTGVEAQVHIQGTASEPQLNLSSNPPLDESDILALIVFNRSVNELGTGERASLAATAGGIATGFIAAPLGEAIGRALDLDIFEITTTTDEGEFGAGLTVGQQIGDRAFIRMRQQFGEFTNTEFLLEYQLARFLRVQTTAAPETTGSANRIGQRRVERGGIDLIFFFSY
jgi:translocation and assembly module TamB